MRMHVALVGLWGLSGCSSSVRPAFPVCGPEDLPYDGIDEDCVFLDEFDADGDGFAPDRIYVDGGWVETHIVARAYSRQFDAPLPQVYGDCNDADPTVYPGAPNDRPGDGVDTNCDRSNDFDADGDGWVPMGTLFDVALYIDQYLDGEVEFEVREGDCDDHNAAIHPGALDVAYDGIDMDCDTWNEFDLDGDGYIAAGKKTVFESWAAVQERSYLVRGFGDCDDDNDFVHPNMPERASTPRDVDCDGDPVRPRLVELDLDVGPTTASAVAHHWGFGRVLAMSGPGAVQTFVFDDFVELDEVPQLSVIDMPASPLMGLRNTEFGMRLVTVGEQGVFQAELYNTGYALRIQSLTESFVERTGTQLVLSDSLGDFVCGTGPTQFLWSDEVGPEAVLCGAVNHELVLCNGAVCTGSDWVNPDEIIGDYALIGGRAVDPQGDQPYAVNEADAFAQENDHAAWIRDGQVYVQTPYGVTGPLEVTSQTWMEGGEDVERRPFYADAVHVRSSYGYAWVIALEHTDNATRVAMARLDP